MQQPSIHVSYFDQRDIIAASNSQQSSNLTFLRAYLFAENTTVRSGSCYNPEWGYVIGGNFLNYIGYDTDEDHSQYTQSSEVNEAVVVDPISNLDFSATYSGWYDSYLNTETSMLELYKCTDHNQ